VAELRAEPAPGLIVSWDTEALAGLASGAPVRRPWTLAGEPANDRTAVRILSAGLSDGSALVVAAVREADAPGHDSELIAGLVVDAEGAATELEEVLLSTEYDADGRIRRAGLEVYRKGDDYPLRAAGDALPGAGDTEGAVAHLDFRMDGRQGRATYEVVGGGA
jgi:hypothetical protein